MTVAAILFLGVGALAWWWVIRRHHRDVSDAWMIDHQRRAWGAGVDQAPIAWPIQKDDTGR